MRRDNTVLWIIAGVGALASVLLRAPNPHSKALAEANENGSDDDALGIDKVELAKVELAAQTALYNQTVEGLKTVPTRVAPLFAFGAALIGFVATSVVKEFGPRLIGHPSLAPFLEWGLVTVIILTTASLVLCGTVLAHTTAVVYAQAGAKFKQVVESADEVGSYVQEGETFVVKELQNGAFDEKSAVVIFHAAIMRRQAIALLVSLGKAKKRISWSVGLLIAAFVVTLGGFSYCVTQLGLASTTPDKSDQQSPVVPRLILRQQADSR